MLAYLMQNMAFLKLLSQLSQLGKLRGNASPHFFDAHIFLYAPATSQSSSVLVEMSTRAVLGHPGSRASSGSPAGPALGIESAAHGLVVRGAGRCGKGCRGSWVLLSTPAAETRTRTEGQSPGASTAVPGCGLIMSHVI